MKPFFFIFSFSNFQIFKFFIPLFFLPLSSFAQDAFLLRNAVHKYLAQSNSNFNFALLAEAYNKEARVAFFWPCLMDSVIVDDKIIAVAFEKEPNGSNEWEAIDMFIASNDTNMTKFMQVMGGSDYKVVKPSAVPMEILGNFLYDRMVAVHKALVKKDIAKTIGEIEEFSRAFGLRTCAFSALMSDFIMRGASALDVSEIKISSVNTTSNSATAVMDVFFPSKAVSTNIKLLKIGDGWAIDEMK